MNNIDIILPDRIGDSILTLPALVCLKQLIKDHGPENTNVRIISHKRLFEVFKSLNLFETSFMNLQIKLKSWINPADKTIFLYNSSNNIGFCSKKAYGAKSKKWYVRYSNYIPYFDLFNMEKEIPAELVDFLRKQYKFSDAIIRYFGFCLVLGYTIDQIKSCFNFSPDLLSIPENLHKENYSPINPDSKYIAICMEAAYNRKGDINRRWSPDNFFELAEKIYAEFNLSCVFIGIENEPCIPDKKSLIDLRGKPGLLELLQIIRSSVCYIGNDSGLLHIANLLHKESFCIGLIPAAKLYTPLFHQYYHLIWQPEQVEDVLTVLKENLWIKS